MTPKSCFRCDWQGETEGTACPACGARPLFVAEVTPPGPTPSETPAATTVDAPIRSNRRLIVTFGLIALALVLAFVVANIDRPEPGLAAAPIDSSTTQTPTPTPSRSSSSSSNDLTPRGLKADSTRTVEIRNVSLTFHVPTLGWQQSGDLLISKSTVGPQSAEALIYWTGIGGSNGARACGQWWGAPPGSIQDYARSATKMSGADLVTGPWNVQLDGLTAAHVAMIVRKDRGCYPGWFYRWPDELQGSFWEGMKVGDTVRIWIVDVGRTRIYIEADTHQNADGALTQEVQRMVESIELDSLSRD